MATVYVNDKPVDIGNEKLNLIQAALKGGVFIPHYCWHPGLTVAAPTGPRESNEWPSSTSTTSRWTSAPSGST